MSRLLAASFVLVLSLTFVHAQTASEGSAPSTVVPDKAPAAPTQTSGKDVKAQCRAEIKAQELKGAARKAAAEDCFAKARPDLAKRQQCRAQGKAHGLADGPLRQFVKQCAAGA
jgi:hypothetical protein